MSVDIAFFSINDIEFQKQLDTGKVYQEALPIARMVFSRLTHNRDHVEEGSHVAAAKAAQSIGSLKQSSSFPAYVSEIARHTYTDFLRRNPCRNRTYSIDIYPENGNDISTRNLESELIPGIDMPKYFSFLNQGEMQMLMWAYVDGYSRKDIGEMTGKSEGAVKVEIHRLKHRVIDRYRMLHHQAGST